jgi:septal ring factor EnvC (AmiA/AmiB activator)
MCGQIVSLDEENASLSAQIAQLQQDLDVTKRKLARAESALEKSIQENENEPLNDIVRSGPMHYIFSSLSVELSKHELVNVDGQTC